MMRASAFLFALVLGCGPDVDEELSAQIEIIGHGGGGFQSWFNPLPENSASSIRRGIEGFGADAVEVDIQLTRDGALILYHDMELGNATFCRGCLARASAEAARSCRFRASRPEFSGNVDHLLRLEDALALHGSRKPPPRFYLDVKIYGDCLIGEQHSAAMAQAIVEAVERSSAAERVAVQSFDADLLVQVKKALPSVQAIYRTRAPVDGMVVALAQGFDGVLLERTDISAVEVAMVRRSGLRVLVYNVRSEGSTREAVALRPDGIQTDHISMLRGVLGR